MKRATPNWKGQYLIKFMKNFMNGTYGEARKYTNIIGFFRQGHLSPIELPKCMYNIVPDLAIHKIYAVQFLWNLKVFYRVLLNHSHKESRQ